jgi:hypothetical protein
VEIAQICSRYLALKELTTDQFGYLLLPLLRARFLRMKHRPHVHEVPDNSATQKLRRWERTKTAMGLGWCHAFEDNLWDPIQVVEPDEEPEGASLLRMELSYLQRKGNAIGAPAIGPPAIGPVTTDDAADCWSWLVSELLADQIERYEAHQRLLETPVAVGARGGYHSGTDPYPHMTDSWGSPAMSRDKWAPLDRWVAERAMAHGGYGRARNPGRPMETERARRRRRGKL